MKKFVVLLCAIGMFWGIAEGFTQPLKLQSAKLVETLSPVLGSNQEVLRREIHYSINCRLQNATRGDSAKILDAQNWQVFNDGQLVKLSQILWRRNRPHSVKLVGAFGEKDKLVIKFTHAEPAQGILVSIDQATVGKTKWGFGKNQALDFNLQRLMNQKALYAFEYQFKVNVMERNLFNNHGNFWLRSLSLNLISSGTFASDDTVRNGTQSSFELAFNPFYFASGLIYRSELNFSYQIETEMNDPRDKVFDVLSRHLKLGLEVEIPWSNYPIFKLHTQTGYARLAMPVTLNLDYVFSGEDDKNNDTPARLEFKARYELAFSPYLIVQGQWRRTKFYDAPPGFDDSATFYSIAIAQDLDAVKKTLGILKIILGPEEEMRGKNFIFFRLTKGRKAPDFEDIDEKVIGFGTYF